MASKHAAHFLASGSVELAEHGSRESPNTVFDRRAAAVVTLPIGGKSTVRDVADDFDYVRIRQGLPGPIGSTIVKSAKTPKGLSL